MPSTRLVVATLLATGVLLAAAVVSPHTASAQRRGGQAADDSARDPLATAVRGVRFRAIGPAVVSGRISDVAIHPDEPNTWYVATASGGVWKTTNAGTTFTAVMDGEGSYSFGAVAIDPTNPNVIWVGSGENNPQRSVAFGDGVYKSLDAGRSWKNVGLPNSEHIARILIDPRNSDVVYVAAQGPLYSAGGDRGLFKTTDGGATWTNVLESGEWGGVADAVMDPRDPDVLIAATWQRARRQWTLIAGGPASGLHRSTDGGQTWTKVQSGLPSEELGRIGLAISPVDGDVVYAIMEAVNDAGGFYRSDNNGINWRRMSDRATSSNYYQEIFADPVHVNRVYSVDTRTAVTNDGGRTWDNVGLDSRHVDDHVVWIDPRNPDHLLIGGDGGLYQTFDRGESWDWFQNLPLGQFYRVDADNVRPFYRVMGGTQDNSSFIGPSRTLTRRGAHNGDWMLTQGGDGFYSRVDPTDSNIVYAESQHAGLSRFNLATGEEVAITPLAEPGEPDLRWHWDAPLIISPHAPARLYFAAQKVFRSDDRGSTWTAVSGDLTAQIDRNRLKVMGRVWSVDAMAKNRSTSTWNSIVALEESRLKEGLLWVGTDDGVVQVTEDGGQTWRRIGSIRGVPDTTFVSRVTPSQHDVNTVYVSFDNHKAGDYKPYIAKSTDLGRSWEVIQGNLPAKGTVYVVIEDHVNPNMLYAGTEYGVFFTRDGGQAWQRLRSGLPTIKVPDMVVQREHDDLVIATFGRGFYILDDLETLRALTPERLGTDGLLPVGRTPLYVEANPDPDWQGGRFWTAGNPDDGATIYYHLRAELRTRKARRHEAERRAARAGEDVFYPPWDSLRAEDREEDPTMVLTIADEEGRVVRRLTGRTSAGLQRVTWDLRYPSAAPIRAGGGGGPGGGGGGGFFGGGGGPYVAPGTYTVTLAQLVDGETTPVGEPQRFEVYPVLGDRTPRSAEVVAFQRQAAQLQRAMLGAGAALNEAMTRVNQLEQALAATPGDVAQLSHELRALEEGLVEVQVALNGDPTRDRRSEPDTPSLQSRLFRFTGGAWSGSLQEVTGEQRKQYGIVAAEFGGILERLRQLVEVELTRIEEASEAAGAPWTSGRVPTWRP
jgi:photosystem II stability/assembly factor-like uncharacterized protein